jgi:hypothetical protein
MASYNLLKVVKHLVLSFWKEKGLAQTDAFQRVYQNFDRGIDYGISHTLESIKRPSDFSQIALIIATIFESDPNKAVAKNEEKFFKSGSKIFFRYKNYFYFQGKVAAEYIGALIDTDLSVTALSRELNRLNLLVIHGGEYSSKLPLPLRKYTLKRFYCLKVDALIELIENVYTGQLYGINSPIKELRPQ